jgi:two-component sensor histidine kinase
MFVFVLALWSLVAVAESEKAYERDNPAYSFRDQIMLYMDSLNIYVAQGDTENIAFVATSLITRFQRASMPERADYYIKLVQQYIDRESHPVPYSRFCNHVGMYMASKARLEGQSKGDTNLYHRLNDSSRWWFRQGIRNAIRSNEVYPSGWGYRGLLQVNCVAYLFGLHRYDSVDFYYRKCLQNARKVDDPQLIRASSEMYGYYLVKSNRLDDAAEVIALLGKNMPTENVSNNLAYYRILHNYLARKNDLDTLYALSDSLVATLRTLLAAKHSEGIYEADQRFEVSQTKKVLQSTVEELNKLSSGFFLLLGVLVVLLAAAAFIFSQYRKNRQLALRNEALLKEQNHRVKNNLQMVASLLSLQSKKVTDAEARRSLKDNEARVQSISLLNRLLYQQQDIAQVDFGAYLATLTEELKYSAGREVDIALQVPDAIGLKVEKSTSMGLVLNELITNSLKHGGPSLTEIGIAVEKPHASALCLTYHDNGAGCDAGTWEASRSFGHQLVKIQLKQLYADYQIFNGQGFTFKMQIPV